MARKIPDWLEREMKGSTGDYTASVADEVARKGYSLLPAQEEDLILIFNELVDKGEWPYFWLVTQWIKRKKSMYQLKFMPYYEDWLYQHIHSWGACDCFCGRVLNPMVEKYPELFSRVLVWAESKKTYVRRAAPVSLIQSGRSFRVNQDKEKVFAIVEKLKNDGEIHVQKGLGWLLKYAYLAYPDDVYLYLKNNVRNLPRIVFRYALEKTPDSVREELMSL